MTKLLNLIQAIKNRPELTILLLLGFFIRIIGIHPGYFAHGDELMYGEAVYMILHKTLGMEPQILGYYPPLVAWIMLAFFVLIFIPVTFIYQIPYLISNLISSGSFVGLQSSNRFFEFLIFGHNWINAMYWGRYTTAFFGTSIIVLTYYLSYKIFNSRLTSFLAALFVTVNYRLVLNSKIGFPDIFGTFFLLTSILAILSLLEKPTYKNYIFACVAVGLSFLVKYQLYTALSIFIVHLLISLRESKLNYKKFLSNFFSKKILFGCTVTLLFIIASHYYHFQNWDRVRGMYEYQALKYGLGVNSLNIYPISYIYHVMIGSFLSLSAFGGIILGIVKKKYKVATIILAPVITYNAFVYLYYSTGGTYTRNFLAIIPILLIFSAVFISWIFEYFVFKQKIKPLKIILSSVLTIVILISIYDHLKNVYVSNQVLSHPSARIQIENWVESNIPENVTIGNYQGGFQPQEQKFLLKTFANTNEVLSFKELTEEGIHYFIVDFYIVNNSFVWWMGQPTDIALKFWSKPDGLLSQSFISLAIRELLWNHTVQAYLPRWQVPGYNYIVAKINTHSKTSFKHLKSYNFNQDIENWQKLHYFEENKNVLSYSKEFGSLLIINEKIKSNDKIRRIYSRPGALRWQSPAIGIKKGYSYKATGKIMNLHELKKDERNGFLRLDFYSEIPVHINDRSIISFVSQRVFGQNIWHEVGVEGVAPEDANYLTVSFQVDQGRIPYYLDGVEVFESDLKIQNPYQNKRYTISDDDLFNPNDGGFL